MESGPILPVVSPVFNDWRPSEPDWTTEAAVWAEETRAWVESLDYGWLCSELLAEGWYEQDQLTEGKTE